MSPAQRAFARKTAAIAAAATAASPALARPSSGSEATEYERMRAELGEDLKQLREIQSIERKIELKRTLLPKYEPWVGGVLDAAAPISAGGKGERGVQDDILVQTMIWRIDTGDFAGAIPLVDYVLRWSLALPERFSRTAATMIAEEIAEAALKALDRGEAFDLEILLTVEQLVADEDMHDEVRAKLEKAIGRELDRQAKAIAAADGASETGPAGARRAAVEGALKRFRRAVELHAGAGVKKDIERLSRESEKLAAAAAAEREGQ